MNSMFLVKKQCKGICVEGARDSHSPHLRTRETPFAVGLKRRLKVVLGPSLHESEFLPRLAIYFDFSRILFHESEAESR